MKFDDENLRKSMLRKIRLYLFIYFFFSGREWLRGLVTVEEDSTNWKV